MTGRLDRGFFFFGIYPCRLGFFLVEDGANIALHEGVIRKIHTM